jgi:HEAT repeat protein
VQPLIAALKDSNRDVRRLAAYALGEIGPAAKPAVPTLKAMMDGSDRAIDNQAANSINSIEAGPAQERIPNVQTP